MQLLTESGLKTAIVDRRQELSRLDHEVSSDRLIERLVVDRPWHPYILMWHVMSAAAATFAGGTAIALILPIYSLDIARLLLVFDTAAGMTAPALFAILAVSSFLMAQGARQLVIFRGASSPLLHDELGHRLRLQGEIARLTTVVEVRKRTATPTTPRVRRTA